MASCKDCLVDLVLNENWSFSRSNSNSYICKTCHNAANRRWKLANREKVAAYPRNLEKSRQRNSAWRARHPEEEKAKNIQWNLDNPHKAAAKTARRRSLKNAAADPTANQATIAHLYSMARHLTVTTGTEYEVDHIIPLSRGGLHHEDNLVVMRRDFNRAKGNLIVPAIISFLLPGYAGI